VSRAVALVPARNEEDLVAGTVKSLASIDGVEVVVVADGCADGTMGRAVAAGARVVATPRPLGKGSALEGALDRVPRADVYLLVDADTGETAKGAEVLLDEVRSGRLDLAIGVLPSAEGGGFGLVRRVSSALIARVSGFEAEAPLSGQRAITGQALEACRPLAGGFGLEAAMTIDAVRLGFRVGEISVRMGHRPTGRSVRGFAHRGRQGLDVARAVLPRALGVR
jgi:hypothetical protein